MRCTSLPPHFLLIVTSSPPHYHVITTSSPPSSPPSLPPHHHLITASSPPHHRLITASSPPHHRLITVSSPSHHHLITTSSPPQVRGLDVFLKADGPAVWVLLTTLAQGRFSNNAFLIRSHGETKVSFIPFVTSPLFRKETSVTSPPPTPANNSFAASAFALPAPLRLGVQNIARYDSNRHVSAASSDAPAVRLLALYIFNSSF